MKKNTNKRKPPSGLMPKYIWKEKRFYEVCSAITRYYQAGFEIPIKWIKEYNNFIKKKK